MEHYIDLPLRNFAAQARILQHPARFKVVQKGRRFGMTRGAAHWLLWDRLAGRYETARRMADALRTGRAVERYGGARARLIVSACPTDAWSYVFEPEFKQGARSRLPLEEALTLAATERLRRFALWRAATAPEQ